MSMMHPGWMAWGGLGGAVGLLLALALAVLAAVALTRVLLPRPPDPTVPDTALDVLRTRFASGEIDEAEYLRRRATLSHSNRGVQP
jgi:putative membrane protein